MVKVMVDDVIVIRENYFSVFVKKIDISKVSLYFFVFVVRYVVKEVFFVWYFYGGKDFGIVFFIFLVKSY